MNEEPEPSTQREGKPRRALPKLGEYVVGRFRIDSLIGTGGMAHVFAARDTVESCTVALKVLDPELSTNAEAVERFSREVRAMSALRNEHVVQIREVGILGDGLPFFVMDYLEGADLTQVVISRGPLPYAEACMYIEQACEALEEAHAAGLVHRDIKPPNLFLARRSDGTVSIRVLDFGIARAVYGSLKEQTITQAGIMVGTLAYMAPEQVRDSSMVDARADIWALGACLYRILTNRVPFFHKTEARMIDAIVRGEMKPIRRYRFDVPKPLEEVIQRCLQRDPNDRFSTAHELRAALREARLACPPIDKTPSAATVLLEMPRAVVIPERTLLMPNAPSSSQAALVDASSSVSVARYEAEPAAGARWSVIVAIVAIAIVVGGLLGVVIFFAMQHTR